MKLFQKIRQSLIKSGNLKRYLIYAIGEILLIMVGVLLAFQVSKWNESRNNNNAELIYYQNIKRQINEDKGVISRNIDYNNRYLDQFERAIQIIEANDRNKTDSLVAISINLFRYSDFHRTSNIYESIVNSGQIKLFSNQEIIEGLQRLEENYVYINKMEDIHLDLIKLNVMPDLLNTIRLSSQKVDNPDNLYTFQFKNRFTILVEIMKEKNYVYDEGIEEINKIIEMIDKELKVNN